MSGNAVANDAPFGILAAGLVTSVGLGVAASCAAIRAGMRNPVTSNVPDRAGERLVVHRVPVDSTGSAVDRLIDLAAHALHDCVDDRAGAGYLAPLALPMPVIACVSEAARPGHVVQDHDGFLHRLGRAVDLPLHVEHSCVVPGGRPGVLVALAHARRLVRAGAIDYAMIVATDSLLGEDTLTALAADDRLLASDHSDGFMPGEAAGALLVGRVGEGAALVCEGLGFGVEPAPFGSGAPMRADGLVKALRGALAEAHCTTADTAFRVTDHSGEQYYFREAAIALSRVWQGARSDYDWWLPAASTGEVGAASGAAMLASAMLGYRDGVAPGPRLVVHASADGAHRAAGVFAWRRGI